MKKTIRGLVEWLSAPLQQENLPSRAERMIPAALYGILAASAYTLSISLVNVYTFPNLPLGFDWPHIFGTWLGFSLVISLFGIIANWFTEDYVGIVGGGGLITLLLAIIFFLNLETESRALTLQSILMALPLIGVSMLATGILRWVSRRHLEIVHKESPENRPKRLTKHILLIALVGLLIGVFGRLDLPAEQTLTNFDKYLQAAPNDPSAWMHLPIKQVPSLTENFGSDYVFYVRRSEFSLGSLDLTVRFEDGFVMKCLFSIGKSNFFSECYEEK